MAPPGFPGGLRPRRQRRPAPADPALGRLSADWVEAPERPRRRGRWLATAVAVTVISLGAGAATGSLAPRRPVTWLPATASGSVAPVLGPLGADAPRPTPALIAAKIQSLFGDASLGGFVTASVVDVASAAPLFDLGGSTTVAPASTAKLLTAAAVLSARGPAYRIPTKVVAGRHPGQVIIVGGGDPTLAQGVTGSYPGAARLDQLAEQVKKALGDTPPTSVVVDSSLFVGATFASGWLVQDAKDGFISNITALMTDGARRNAKQVRSPAPRFEQPDLAAGQQFAKLLGVPANQVTLEPGAASGPAQQLGVVESPAVARLVEIMLGESDNIVAEALARQIALARGVPASFEGAADATMDALRELGLPTGGFHLADGSGLSHLNRISAQLLTAVLVHAASSDRPELRAILSGLPVAAYSGTLVDRFRSAGNGGAAAGVVRAKTGTLGGFHVSALAGIAVDADGRLLAFSIVTNGATNTFAAQNALDRIAAAIASCGCS
jgi:D-alanyl-D-alanine carboxypeptidase/D-alanyl-D-alanine-endopeptidase (penicillin-binding protein 4)